METYLNYDDQGFIIGTKRLESGIKSIGEDTQEIIQILKSQNQINQTTLNRIAKSNERIANKRTMRVQGTVPVYDPKKTSRPSTTASQPATSNTTSTNKSKITSNATVKTVEPTAKSGSSNSPDGLSGAGSKKTRGSNNPAGKNGRNKSHKERDESGRFKSRDKSLFESLSNTARRARTGGYNSYGGGNQDIDPLIASVTELKDAASPMLNIAMQAGGMVGRSAVKAGRFSFSKYKSLKRKEPLPKEQQRHNKQNEETLGEILKRMGGGESSLLDSLGGRFGLFGGGRGKGRKKGKGVKAILSGAGASVLGAGKHGGRRIGKVAKALGRTRVLAPLATAIGVGSLASQWDDMDHKQKSAGVGSLAGGGAGSVIGGAIGTALIPVPAVGTAVGAAVGGWIGSEGGEILGSIASPFIKSWTDNVKAYNLPQKMENAWRTGLSPVLNKLQQAAGSMRAWLTDKASGFGGGVRDFFGFGDSGLGDWKVDFGSGLTSAKDGVTYKMGAKNFKGGVIDCSGWVDQLNKDTVRQIEEQLGPEAAKRARIDASGGAAGIIQTEEKKGRMIASANSWDQLDLNKLQAGMVIGESRGNHAKGLHKNIGHIVQIIEENGVKYVSESTSAKGKDGRTGVRKTELSEYVKNLNGRQFGVTVVDPYKEFRGQLKGGGNVDVSSSRLTTQQQKARRDEAMQYFMSQGWTKEQAAGIVGNVQKESMFNHKAKGDKNKKGVYQAYGLAQWHPDRQANFKRAFGKDIRQASYKEQLAFINYELTKGTEQSAGKKLRQAKTAAQAGAIVSEFYERPSAKEKEKRERAKIAEGIYNSAAAKSVQQKTQPTNSALGFNIGGLANNLTASTNTPVYQPASQSIGLDLGASILKNVFNIPEVPSFKIPLAGGGQDRPIVVQSNNEAIGQNVSDRDLAHAITGGIGMMRGWD